MATLGDETPMATLGGETPMATLGGETPIGESKEDVLLRLRLRALGAHSKNLGATLKNDIQEAAQGTQTQAGMFIWIYRAGMRFNVVCPCLYCYSWNADFDVLR